ncbi:MAG: (Fe-S)-binding protein, partial [Salinarimonas sp.]
AVSSPEDVIGDGRDIVLFGDTFNRYFEPENLTAASRVLARAGYRLHRVAPPDRGRPLCCGRTFLSAGQVEEARAEAQRTRDALIPFVERGARVIGLEPSCLLTLRDEFHVLLPDEATQVLSDAAFLFEEALASDLEAGVIDLAFADQGGRKAYLHGHCHQKSFEALAPVEALLRAVPGLSLQTIESSCCGMAGAFGYDAHTIETSFAMGELTLFPALRKAEPDAVILADGTSCRHQIGDGVAREAQHVARFLDGVIA